MKSLSHLQDEVLIQELKAASLRERQALNEVIAYLEEVERRRLYLKMGYGSLWDYVTKALGYSAASAQRRIASMRLIRKMDFQAQVEIKAKINEGKLNLTQLSQVQSVTREEKVDQSKTLELIQKVEGLSSRESERVIANEFPNALIPKDRVKAVGKNQTQITITLDEETMALLEQFKNLSAHRNPKGEIKTAIKIALEIATEKLDPLKTKKLGIKSQKPDLPPLSEAVGRCYLSKALRREVWIKCEGKCQFQDPVTGKKCESRYALQIDHITPLALGGGNELSNLRLLCKNHNLHLGRRLLADLPRDSHHPASKVGNGKQGYR